MMLTGSLDQLAHLSASSPLVFVHIGDLLQLEFGVEDLVPLLSAVLAGRCGIATVCGESESQDSLRIVAGVTRADGHHA